jgi:hypothetical protein
MKPQIAQIAQIQTAAGARNAPCRFQVCPAKAQSGALRGDRLYQPPRRKKSVQFA